MASNRYETPPAWAAAEATDAQRKQDRARELREAQPVRLVDVRLPFGAIVAIVIQVTIVQVVIGVAVAVALYLLGVL